MSARPNALSRARSGLHRFGGAYGRGGRRSGGKETEGGIDTDAATTVSTGGASCTDALDTAGRNPVTHGAVVWHCTGVTGWLQGLPSVSFVPSLAGIGMPDIASGRLVTAEPCGAVSSTDRDVA